MSEQQRINNRATALGLHYKLPPKFACPNCGVKTHTGHFAPPSFGDPGFFVCVSPETQPPQYTGTSQPAPDARP